MHVDIRGVEIRGKGDPEVIAFAEAIASYKQAHPGAEIVVRRQNSVSIRGRIIDPGFREIPRSKRHEIVWNCFTNLDELVQDQISMLLLLTPEEQETSLANFEFEHPIPSRL